MILYSSETKRKNLFNLIESISLDTEVTKLLASFILKELDNPSYQINCTEKIFRTMYERSIISFINFMNGFLILNLTWYNFCVLLKDLHRLEKVYIPIVDYLFREFFKYAVANTSIINTNIIILKKFNHFLNIPERPSIKPSTNISLEIFDKFYLNFHPDSTPEQLYLYTTLSQSSEQKKYSTLINLNTNNKFLRNILIDFIEYFPKNTSNKRTARLPTVSIFRQFIYYFNKSLYLYNDSTIDIYTKIYLKEYNSIFDFDYKTFRKQFRFYSKIDLKYPVTQYYKKDYGTYRYSLIDILKSFYIYLYNYIEDNNLNHNPFANTGIDKSILLSSNFNSNFKDGYLFIKDTRLQAPPSRNRIAVVITKNSDRARSVRQNIRSFDFTKVTDKEHRKNLIDFTWNYNASLSRRNNMYFFIIDFLKFKDEWDLENSNIYTMYKENIFTVDFMFSYRLYVMNRYNSNSSMDAAVLSVKSFLKYHKKKYCTGEFIYKYLECFERIRLGGKPIPDEDFNLIVQNFTKIRSISIKNELSFIVFYLSSTTKLRLGSILNLKRDCIIHIDEEKKIGTIKFYSKISDRNYITEILTLNCINFIKYAIQLTEDIAKIADKKYKDYIFIHQRTKSNNKYDHHNILFLGVRYNLVFLSVLAMAGLNKKYTPYQVRHTRKNKIYEEGQKKGYSQFEINEMIGGTLQVNLNNYIKINNTKLYTELFTEVTISNVDIYGKIFKSSTEVESLNIVANQMGNCENKSCKYKENFYNNFQFDSTYKCLMCNNFITCSSRLKFFENEIVSTKEKLHITKDYDYRLFLESKLKLLGAFYKRLLDLI